jgi:hypothetical protein
MALNVISSRVVRASNDFKSKEQAENVAKTDISSAAEEPQLKSQLLLRIYYMGRSGYPMNCGPAGGCAPA